MYIALDSDRMEDLLPMYDAVKELNDGPVCGFEDEPGEYRPNGGTHVVDMTKLNPANLALAWIRWAELKTASLGGRLFSDTPMDESPLYAGKIPRTEDEIHRAIVSAKYAEGRAEYFQSFGVNYIGRADISPRTIIVLDNKKDNRLLRPTEDPTLDLLYRSLPADWWGSCGFVSTGNVDKLGEFLDAVPEAIPLAYTPSAVSKLKYLGVDFAQVDPPSDDPYYGRIVREKANRLSYELSFK